VRKPRVKPMPESTVRNRCRLANLLIDSCIGPYRRRMRSPQLHPRVPPGADPVPGVIIERPGDEPLDGRMEPWPDPRGRSPPIANVKLPPYLQGQRHEVSLVSAEIPSSPSPEPQDVPPRREGLKGTETLIMGLELPIRDVLLWSSLSLVSAQAARKHQMNGDLSQPSQEASAPGPKLRGLRSRPPIRAAPPPGRISGFLGLCELIRCPPGRFAWSEA
jgi:hypothetical protein